MQARQLLCERRRVPGLTARGREEGRADRLCRAEERGHAATPACSQGSSGVVALGGPVSGLGKASRPSASSVGHI